MKILIAGEGKTEIGYWTLPPERHTAEKKRDERGIIDAFLSRCATRDWEIVEGIDWRRIVKYKARRKDAHHSDVGPDGQTVLGLALRAEEKGYDAVIFVRDRDDDPNREKQIAKALEKARADYTPRIAGGVAAQAIESWLLSLKNEKDAERYGTPKDALRDKFQIESLLEKVSVVEGADLDNIRQDARSLHEWLSQVRGVLEESRSPD
jgi:hypothetical protein